MDSEFWEYQTAHAFDDHVRPINEFVDTINAESGLRAPYVAPYYGGVSARVLSVLRDPGRGAHGETGSGFLCIENADPTSARQRTLFADVGITPADMIPWIAYPFFIDRAPKALELTAGAAILRRLLHLPGLDIRVILLQGNEARDVWRRLRKVDPATAARFDPGAIQTIHPSPNALRTNKPDERARREADRATAYAEAARLLRPVAR